MDNLLLKNFQGIFPAPEEPREEFFQRIEVSVVEQEEPAWKKALERVRFQFDVEPRWIICQENSKELHCWEAAALIYDQQVMCLHLPSKRKLKWMQFLISLEEILAHEMVHAVRGRFQEVRFEEILAYQTSSSNFRKKWGALWKSPQDTYLFLAAMGLGWIVYWLVLGEILCGMWLVCGILPFCILGYQMIRHSKDFSLFQKAKSHILPFLKQQQMVLPALLRMTDTEILLFARGSFSEIQMYRSQKKEDLRWNIVEQAYFKS